MAPVESRHANRLLSRPRHGPSHRVHALSGSRGRDGPRVGVDVLCRPLSCPDPTLGESWDGGPAVPATAWDRTDSDGRPRHMARESEFGMEFLSGHSTMNQETFTV